MKILVGIPALYGYQHTKNAIESVIHQNGVDVVFIDNGGDEDIKNIVEEYKSYINFEVIRNEVNVFVNPAWNQIMDHFLKNSHDLLCIMNSDLCLNPSWSEVLKRRLTNYKDECWAPRVVTDMAFFNRKVSPVLSSSMVVTVGLPGVFITLTREQCKLVYPIPETIKVWFGDNWIYERLRKNGHKTVIPNNLIAIHGNSQTVSRVPGISEIIEQDKLEWELIKDLV